MKIHSIITHPGSAHKDDLLACAILLADHSVPVFRREPVPADLEDPEVCVIDVGGEHDPKLLNFDHHQFPRFQRPTCSVSLVLEKMGLYRDANLFLEWIEPVEWFDCRGPAATADWLGMDRRSLSKLHSPIDGALLRAFSKTTQLEPGEPLWEILRMVGNDILGFLRGLRTQLSFLAEHTEVWEVECEGEMFKVLYLPRSENLPAEPTLGMGRFIEDHPQGAEIVATVYPDKRSTGYGLARYRDDPRIDFKRISHLWDVHFTHASGFLAKTTATHPMRIQSLLAMAWKGAGVEARLLGRA